MYSFKIVCVADKKWPWWQEVNIYKTNIKGKSDESYVLSQRSVTCHVGTSMWQKLVIRNI